MVRLIWSASASNRNEHKGVDGLARAARMQRTWRSSTLYANLAGMMSCGDWRRPRPRASDLVDGRSQGWTRIRRCGGRQRVHVEASNRAQLTSRVQAVLQAGVNYRVHTDLLTEPIRPAEAAPPSGARRPIGADAPAEVRAAPDTGVAAPSRQVIAISSVRGGAGGTTLAVNLAWMLARRGRRVALLDLSAVGGHLALHLHLPTPQHWGVLLGAQSAPDAAHVLALTTPHPSPRSRCSARRPPT